MARRRPDPRQASFFDLLLPGPAPAPVVEGAPSNRPGETPMDLALIEAGLACRYSLSMGYALQDETVPFIPRSIAFPVTLKRDRDGTPSLHLSTPACADLPYVRRVEEITGLKATYGAGGYEGSGIGHHAIDLATDEGWERLAETMAHTTLEAVLTCVGLHLFWGDLSVRNARFLMERLGVEEPADRSREALLQIKDGWSDYGLKGGWTAVHAVEEGWIKPGSTKGKRTTHASITPEGKARMERSRSDIAA
ncbi:hypothetical protein [Methylobacterium iners]|uniref:Uncharacterized protein n=1 Tax=Methylobacterium iners TaxID=418707 RepID=A0ABQ4S4S4_9HYPH|nr:hypothetical protein [Methylobacterium iners]GJD97489.1 hypothetical protein OCOJLMKI_4720 [Methylobacterium iners]